MEKKKLNELITYLLNSIKNAEKYAKKELPDIAKQYLENEIKQLFIDISYNIFIIIFSIIVVSFSVFLISTLDFSNKNEVVTVFKTIGLCIVAGGFSLNILFTVDSLVNNVKYTIELKTAPKVVLLNYFRNLINNQ